MVGLEDILGTSVMDKVKAANKKQRRFVFTDLNKKELLVGFKENIEKAVDLKSEYLYDWKVGLNTYHVAILKTPEQLEYKSGIGTGGSAWSMTRMKFGLDFKRTVGVFLSEDQFKSLVEDQMYIIVGYMKEKPWNGKTTISFNVHELVPMERFNEELVRLREAGL